MVTRITAGSERARGRFAGFTLIEMLVVVVVIAILAAVVLPKFSDQARRSRDGALKADLAQIRSSVATFQADTGYYPKLLTDLAATSSPANGVDAAGNTQAVASSDWHGPYMQGNFVGGAFLNDPVSRSAFTYSVATGSVGKVSSSAIGNDMYGGAYSAY